MKAAKDAAASLDAEDGRTDNAVPYIEGQEGMQAGAYARPLLSST